MMLFIDFDRNLLRINSHDVVAALHLATLALYASICILSKYARVSYFPIQILMGPEPGCLYREISDIAGCL